ncbi:hypothetical protein ACFL40_00510 [candidate division KSB1 bacterium]
MIITENNKLIQSFKEITYLAVCGFIMGIISSTFGVDGGIIGMLKQ